MSNIRVEVGRRDVLQWGGAGLAAIAGPVCVGGATRGEEQRDKYENPTWPVGFGDVSVVRTCDGTYYAYGTETPEDVVPIARSDDLVDWTYVGAALEERPGWRDDPNAGVWAPSVSRYDGEYRLYYSYSTWGSRDDPGIGLATAPNPEGPFTDRGPVFRASDLDVTNAIDGELVVVDGTPYMVWGSWDGIYGVELTSDGTEYVPDTAFHMAGDKKEGPMIVEENGYYYLFYSTGRCCAGADSTYEIAVGRSQSFFGPYETRNGTDLRDLNDHHAGTAVLMGTDEFVGPGHNTAIRDDDGEWWMLYHVEATADVETRVLMIDPIRWDDKGWPVVGDDGTPSTGNPVPSTGADDCDGAVDDGDPIEIGEYEARDANGDGLYEDVDGDGRTTHGDANALFEQMESEDVRRNPDAFDFDGNGRFGFSDVLDLLRRV